MSICGSDGSPMFSDNPRTMLEMLRQPWAWEALALPAGVGKIWSYDHLKYAGSTGSTWFHMTPRFSNIFHVMRLWMTLNLQWSQAEARLCSCVLEDAKRIHVCSIWLYRAPHDGICWYCMRMYGHVWAFQCVIMRFIFVVFCRSQWFSNVLKGHLRARLKNSLPWTWRWPREKLPRPAAVHVKVCYGLLWFVPAQLRCVKRISDCCKTLQNSAHGRAGMDFMKKIQKVWMNMNAVPMRRMCLLSFWCWHLLLLMPRPFSCTSNVEQCSNMVPDGTSILQHTIAYSKQCFKWEYYMRLHHLDSFDEVLHIVEMAKGRWWNEVLRCS